MIAESIECGDESWVMKTRSLNMSQTIICDECGVRLDKDLHSKADCPICGSEINFGKQPSEQKRLVVQQQKNARHKGVFH